MEVFRVSNELHAYKLTASGKASRWNTTGQFVIYSGSSRSLSTLEQIVHKSTINPKANYKVMVISIEDRDELFKQIFVNDLPANWRTLAGYPTLQKIANAWYQSQETLILKVPSAVIIKEYNYIINTTHPQFKSAINLVRTEDYFWDERLF